MANLEGAEVEVMEGDMSACTSSPASGDSQDSRLDEIHDWLLLGATEKAKSLTDLADPFRIRTILEIGSGTGAVLERLDQSGFAERYFALEPSEARYQFMIARGAIARLVAAEQSTLRESSFVKDRFDLVLLSHVLEHVEDPARLLSDALDVGELVLIEVPLEGSFLGNVRAAVKARLTGLKRKNNAAGHIQFFGHSDVQALIHLCGGRVVVSRTYVPRIQWSYSASRGSIARRLYTKAILGLSMICGDRIWSRIYHGHYAAIIEHRPAIGANDRKKWPNDSYYQASSVIQLPHPEI